MSFAGHDASFTSTKLCVGTTHCYRLWKSAAGFIDIVHVVSSNHNRHMKNITYYLIRWVWHHKTCFVTWFSIWHFYFRWLSGLRTERSFANQMHKMSPELHNLSLIFLLVMRLLNLYHQWSRALPINFFERSIFVWCSIGVSLMLTLNVRGPSYLGLTMSISWLLMPWLLTSPGHQQPWYWLCRICRFWSYLRKDLECMCLFNTE